MLREDIEGLKLVNSNGEVCLVHGTPYEFERLYLLWSYRNSFMSTELPTGLTKSQIEEELLNRMDVIDSQSDVYDFEVEQV